MVNIYETYYEVLFIFFYRLQKATSINSRKKLEKTEKIRSFYWQLAYISLFQLKKDLPVVLIFPHIIQQDNVMKLSNRTDKAFAR